MLFSYKNIPKALFQAYFRNKSVFNHFSYFSLFFIVFGHKKRIFQPFSSKKTNPSKHIVLENMTLAKISNSRINHTKTLIFCKNIRYFVVFEKMMRKNTSRTNARTFSYFHFSKKTKKHAFFIQK